MKKVMQMKKMTTVVIEYKEIEADIEDYTARVDFDFEYN